ncbi:MAG: secondary thiamine-phosphate synthase enzyme YjbQ [Nitrosomonadales bacterium]|jgi:secondary thiamine-phosphate synthase enzyme
MRQAFGEHLKKTNGRGFYDITPDIRDWLKDQAIKEGLLTIYIQHTSASLLINENYDSDVLVDLETFFSKLVRDGDSDFIHTTEGEDDMPAHIRTALTQTHLSIPIYENRLQIGQWQGIFLFEHRYHAHQRKVALHVIGE